jgi:hypothetical protein
MMQLPLKGLKKNTLADGNAIQLQWLFESTSKPKEQWFEEAGN